MHIVRIECEPFNAFSAYNFICKQTKLSKWKKAIL